MNKYQEALSSIVFTLHLRVKPNTLGKCEDENLEILQELVDIYPEYLELKERATPKKVIFTNVDITTHADEFRIIKRWENCPICNSNITLYYCPQCGQHLDRNG